MTFSLNNRLVVEQYIKEALRREVVAGVATPGQRDGIKGLKVLVGTTLSDGHQIPAGSTAYIRESVLHSHQWASQPLSCDTIKGKFLVVDLTFIEFITTPDGDVA